MLCFSLEQFNERIHTNTFHIASHCIKIIAFYFNKMDKSFLQNTNIV